MYDGAQHSADEKWFHTENVRGVVTTNCDSAQESADKEITKED